jgi:hypothetical protein
MRKEVTPWTKIPLRETATEVVQIPLDADRETFLREHGGRTNGHYTRPPLLMWRA